MLIREAARFAHARAIGAARLKTCPRLSTRATTPPATRSISNSAAAE